MRQTCGKIKQLIISVFHSVPPVPRVEKWNAGTLESRVSDRNGYVYSLEISISRFVTT